MLAVKKREQAKNPRKMAKKKKEDVEKKFRRPPPTFFPIRSQTLVEREGEIGSRKWGGGGERGKSVMR
jgi:hypothetical protein